MGRKQTWRGKYIHLLVACSMMIGMGVSGCASLQEFMANPEYRQADQFMASGKYPAATEKYREILQMYPQAADEALFGIGCIYASPQNPERDYKKSTDSFKKLLTEYPKSKYREPSEVVLSLLGEVAKRDRGASALRKQLEALEKQNESLQKQIEQMKEIDQTLEEKRRAVPPRK